MEMLRLVASAPACVLSLPAREGFMAISFILCQSMFVAHARSLVIVCRSNARAAEPAEECAKCSLTF